MAEAKTAAAKKTAVNAVVMPVNSPKVKCSPCPNNPDHQNIRIYNTNGKTRYSVCDDCGETWKIVAEAADDWSKYLEDLAASLDLAEPTAIGDDPEPMILMPAKEAKEIATRLRGIVKGV